MDTLTYVSVWNNCMFYVTLLEVNTQVKFIENIYKNFLKVSHEFTIIKFSLIFYFSACVLLIHYV